MRSRFVAGLAFWTNWLVFPYFAVAGVYLWLHDRWLPLRSAFVPMLAFFLLGSLPFWIYNIQHGFPTFSFVSDVQTAESRALAFDFALRGAIPMLLGFRDLDGRFVYGWLGAALTAGSAIAAIALVVGLRRSWGALLRGRVRDSEPILALVLLVVAMVAIYSVGLPGRFHVPRYLLPIVTSTLVLLAAALAWLINRSRASRRHGTERIDPALRRADLRARRRLHESRESARAPSARSTSSRTRCCRPASASAMRTTRMRRSPRTSRATAWCSPTMAPLTIRSTRWIFATPRSSSARARPRRSRRSPR